MEKPDRVPISELPPEQQLTRLEELGRELDEISEQTAELRARQVRRNRQHVGTSTLTLRDEYRQGMQYGI